MSSVIFYLNKGVIEDIIIEDIQSSCPNSYDTFNYKNDSSIDFCYLNYCSSNIDGMCDFKILISWIGTDSNNKQLISSSKRYSNFDSFGISSVYENIINTSNNKISGTKDTYNIPSNIKVVIK